MGSFYKQKVSEKLNNEEAHKQIVDLVKYFFNCNL